MKKREYGKIEEKMKNMEDDVEEKRMSRRRYRIDDGEYRRKYFP